MRRILAITLATLLVFGIASADTTFQKIEWLTDEESVVSSLRAAGLLLGNPELSLTNEKVVYFVSQEALNYQPTSLPEYKDYCYSASLAENVKGKIAGYPVKDIILSFAYDGEYKLIAVKIELLGADYNTINEKLTKVYGEGEVKTIEDEGIESILWGGEDNTGILLYTESEGLSYTLLYGRTDADEILANCLAPGDPDDVSGL